MEVSFTRPLEAALSRTRTVLFDGFDPAKYLVIAVAAFLTGLADGCTPSGGFNLDADALTGLGRPGGAAAVLSWALGGFGWFGSFAAIGALLYLILLWVSSNGTLIFLDGVIRDRGAFMEPWGRLSRQSNSLFLWSAALALTAVVTTGLVLLPAIGVSGLWNGFDRDWTWSDIGLGFGIATATGFVVGLLAILILLAWLVLRHFVVPVMYRDGTTVPAAWRKLRPVIRSNAGDFLLYALLVAALHVGVGLLLGMLTVATCCISGFILAIPYVNTLLLLPWLVFLRLFSVEFLSQFGPEVSLAGAGAAVPGRDPGGGPVVDVTPPPPTPESGDDSRPAD